MWRGSSPLAAAERSSSNAREGTPPAGTPAEGAVDGAAPGSLLIFDRLELRDVAIHPSVVQGRTRVLLPPITFVQQSLDMHMLASGLSIGLLNSLTALMSP